jgi:hypothetical protein
MKIESLRTTVRQTYGKCGRGSGGSSLRYSAKQSNGSSWLCPLNAARRRSERARLTVELLQQICWWILVAEWVDVLSDHQKWINFKGPGQIRGQMASSVLCADSHNEFCCGAVPGKMTETFQDVSTVKCS